MTSDAALEEVVKINEMLWLEIAELKAKVADLEELLNKNSSFPPLRDTKKVERPKKRSDKKHGAQSGHPGKARSLLLQEKVTQVVECLPDTCTYGGEQEKSPGYRPPASSESSQRHSIRYYRVSAA